MKQNLIKALCLVFTFVILLGVIPFSAFAAKVSNPMDGTYVVDDLNKDGVNFAHYPKDPSATFVSVIEFQEYGYDWGGNQSYYGLYLYLYNPSGDPITTTGNKLQLAYVKSNGTVSNYEKYDLTLKSVSNSESDSNLFYKFKVEGTSKIVREVPSGAREYRLSGIELSSAEFEKKTDYPLEQSWTYTGYQSNFGKDGTEADSLRATVVEFETIQIEMKPATWFSKTSDLGEDYRYEVSSVYFNIPDHFINKYGDPWNKASETSGLYAVRGEYYKYVTNGLLVPDQTWYDKFYESVGYDYRFHPSYTAGSYVDELPAFYHTSYYNVDETGEVTTNFALSYNMFIGGFNNYRHTTSSNKILYSFQNLAISENGVLSRKDFETAYNRFGRGKYTTAEHLFLGSSLTIDQNYVPYYITVEDGVLNDRIKSYAQSEAAKGKNWLFKAFNKELYTDEGGYPDIQPIVEVSKLSFDLADLDIFKKEELAEKYFVSVGDAEELAAFCDKYDSNSHIYLMRYDVNPYYCSHVGLTERNSGANDLYSEGGAYYFEKAIHEDFDILEFTFRNAEGKESIVPVVADPIDNLGFVVPGDNRVEPNPNNPGDSDGKGGGGKSIWDKLKGLWDMLGGFGKVLAVVVVIILILLIWKFLGRFILAIFKGIGALFGGIGRAISGGNRAYEHKADRHTEKVERERRHAQEDADELRKEREEARRAAEELRKEREQNNKDAEDRRKQENHDYIKRKREEKE